MSTEEYVAFRTFNSIEEAEPILQIFKDTGIDYEVASTKNNLNSSFGGMRNAFEVQVLIKPSGFTNAEKVLEEAATQVPLIIDKDNYLLGFSTEELMEIVEKQDEWSPDDYMRAQQILRDRGHSVDTTRLNKMKEQRLEELRQPEAVSPLWVTIGYITAILGGFLGIFMGWALSNAKKTLPNGERVYSYDEASRRTGRNMMFMGILFFIINLIGFWVVIDSRIK
jgi:hypothetical protein